MFDLIRGAASVDVFRERWDKSTSLRPPFHTSDRGRIMHIPRTKYVKFQLGLLGGGKNTITDVQKLKYSRS